MKTTVLLYCFTLGVATAQVSPPSPPPSAPEPAPLPGLFEAHDSPVLADQVRDLERVAERAQRHVEAVHVQLAQAGTAGMSRGHYGTGSPVPLPPPAPGVPGAPRHLAAAQVLVLPGGDLDAAQQQELAEDLAVMSRVLERATDDESGNRRLRAMGVDLMFLSGARPARTVYLQDYGVVFTLQVSFPLLPAVAGAKEADDSPTSAEDAEWEAARREVHGGSEAETVLVREMDGVLRERYGLGTPAEQFVAAKVDELCQSILGAVKNAARIRHLKADDYILVLVQAPAAGPTAGATAHRKEVVRQEINVRSTGDNPAPVVWSHATLDSGAGRGGAMMTLRVRRSDAEALAEGSIDLEELQNRAAIHIAPAPAAPGGWLGF